MSETTSTRDAFIGTDVICELNMVLMFWAIIFSNKYEN